MFARGTLHGDSERFEVRRPKKLICDVRKNDRGNTSHERRLRGARASVMNDERTTRKDTCVWTSVDQ